MIAAGMEASNASIARFEINSPLKSRLVANISPELRCLNFTRTIFALVNELPTCFTIPLLPHT